MNTLKQILAISIIAVPLAACGNSQGERALSGGGIGAGVGAAGAALTGGSVLGGAILGGGSGNTSTLPDPRSRSRGTR